MRRRTIWVSITVFLLAVIIGGVLWLRARGAPEAARLLPEADAVIYISFKPIRLLTDWGKHPVTREPEYEEFVRETGFQFERDLDEAAIAVHPPEPALTNGQRSMERRFSEIFVGTIDDDKVKAYLRKLASSTENYENTEIFSIPHEDRTVRVALLSVDTVAVSNTADSSVIRGMIDRYHKIAMPFGGPKLVEDNYDDVPLGATAWTILKIPSPDGRGVSLPLPAGIAFTLPPETVTVGSLRYLGDIQFKLEAFTQSPADAEHLENNANNFLQLFRAIENSAQPRGPDDDVKTFFAGIKVERKNKRVQLTATLPKGFAKKLLEQTPDTVGPTEATPAEQPKQPTPAKKKSKR
jgi:hypothetical protein